MSIDSFGGHETKEFTLQVNNLNSDGLESIKNFVEDLDTEIVGVVFKCKDPNEYYQLATRFVGHKWKAEHIKKDSKRFIEYFSYGEDNLRGHSTDFEIEKR